MSTEDSTTEVKHMKKMSMTLRTVRTRTPSGSRQKYQGKSIDKDSQYWTLTLRSSPVTHFELLQVIVPTLQH